MKKKVICTAAALSALVIGAMPLTAQAQVTVGVTVPLTGPASVLGIGAERAIQMMPKEINGVTVKYVILDDGSDVTNAVVNANKLISQDNIDVILGPSTSPQALAIVNPVAASKTPMIAFASSRWIIQPLSKSADEESGVLMDATHSWIFKPNPSDNIWVNALIASWKKKNVKTLAFFGFSDAYGESILTELRNQLSSTDIKLIDIERFSSRDMSVEGQAIKIFEQRPDAVVIAASGTPALLPETTLKGLGYQGLIYQNNPAATTEFLKNGGVHVDGTFVVTGPCLVYEQLPTSNSAKASCSSFVGRYETRYGAGSRNVFAYQAYDAWTLLSKALPVALAKAKPGTPEFRAALRTALEQIKNLPGDSGVFDMSPTDHMGLDARATVIVQVQNGEWKLSQ